MKYKECYIYHELLEMWIHIDHHKLFEMTGKKENIIESEVVKALAKGFPGITFNEKQVNQTGIKRILQLLGIIGKKKVTTDIRIEYKPRY